METNPYEYDTTIRWKPQQNQLYEGRYVTPRTDQQQPPVLQKQRPQPTSGNQKLRPPQKMPKAQTLALARTFKKWLVVASIVSFGTFSGLVALHQVSSTTTTSNSTSSKSSQTTSTSSTSSNTSSSQNSSSFLNQGGNNVGSSSSSSSSQGSTSGSNSTSSTSTGAVSGTSTS